MISVNKSGWIHLLINRVWNNENLTQTPSIDRPIDNINQGAYLDKIISFLKVYLVLLKLIACIGMNLVKPSSNDLNSLNKKLS